MYLKYFLTWAQVIAIDNDMEKKKPFLVIFFILSRDMDCQIVKVYIT